MSKVAGFKRQLQTKTINEMYKYVIRKIQRHYTSTDFVFSNNLVKTDCFEKVQPKESSA